MRVFTAVLLIGTFFVLIAMPEKIHADSNTDANADCPPVQYKADGDICDLTCGELPYEFSGGFVGDMMCLPGYFCKPGYVRRYTGSPCIPRSDCPQVKVELPKRVMFTSPTERPQVQTRTLEAEA